MPPGAGPRRRRRRPPRPATARRPGSVKVPISSGTIRRRQGRLRAWSGARGSGGEGGIRTRDGLPRTAFPVRRHSPLGDLSPVVRCRSFPKIEPTDRDRDLAPVGPGGRGQGDEEHESERTRRCVSERAEATNAGIGRAGTTGSGGEGGIRTRGAFAHRFSRAAPSTTRTPLRGRGYQTTRRDRSAAARQATGVDLEEGLGLVAADAADDLDPSPEQRRCWASWMTVPAAPSGCSAARRRAPRRRSRGARRRTSRRARGSRRSSRRRGSRSRACGPPRGGRRRPRAPSGRSSPGRGHGLARPSPRRRRPRPRSGRSPRLARQLRLGEGLAHEQLVVHGHDASRRPSADRQGRYRTATGWRMTRGALGFRRHGQGEAHRRS